MQRVPETEAQGRIHTSTATVAVLPQAEEVDVQLDDADIRLDLFHSGGAGGQNVNKVQTGVRLTHEPSGIVVTCTDERSQLKNKLKAKAVLRARLYELEQREAAAERAEARRAQLGSGDRAEKIRTYNFPENRVTDHRIGTHPPRPARPARRQPRPDDRRRGGSRGGAAAGGGRRVSGGGDEIVNLRDVWMSASQLLEKRGWPTPASKPKSCSATPPTATARSFTPR